MPRKGQTDATKLAELRDSRIQAEPETIRKSLVRNWRAEHLFSELGRDMGKWPTAAHFASWLALCPDNDISNGRILWRGFAE
ncbi:MAG: hypothetical protein WA324_29000 [Bryobacteraceae bacterium]